MNTDKKGFSPPSSAMRALWLVGFVALPLVIAFVYREVLSGAVSVSRIYQLAQRDLLFRQYMSTVKESYDPAVYQCMAPYFKQIGELLKGHIMPLWNPDVGLGSPLVGDILMAPFWPLRMLTAGLPAEFGINLVIVINVIVTACGAYFFGYTLKLSPWASFYLAFAMAFCPYLLFTNELVGGTVSLIPLLFAGFYLVSKPGVTRTKFQTFGTCFFAAICCALMIVSGHPEPSLYAVFYASALLVARFAFQRNVLKPGVVLRSLGIGFWRVSFIGMLSFGLSAPAFLPFLEYLGNSDCYKKALSQPGENLSFPSVVMDLFHPLYGHASPFLGIGTAFLLVYAIVAIVIHWRRKWRGVSESRADDARSKPDDDSLVGTGRCLLLVWFLSLVGMLTGQSINYQGIFSILGWLLPHYCYPVFMLLTAALAAFALDAIVLNSEFRLRRRAELLIVFAVCALFSFAGKIFPWLLTFASSEAGLTVMQVATRQLVKDQIVLAVLLLCLLFAGMIFKGKRAFAFSILSVVFLALFISEGGAATRSLSPKPKLSYSAVAPLPVLIAAGERVAPVGRHVLCPATNLAYDIRSLLPSNVYHPSRFLPFVEHCGITEEGINLFLDRRISRLVNIASVKYLVTPRPVLRSEDRFGQDADAMLIPDAGKCASVTFGDGVEKSILQRASLAYDPVNREIIGTLYWRLFPAHKELGAYQLLTLAEDGKTLWLGDLNDFGSIRSGANSQAASGARSLAGNLLPAKSEPSRAGAGDVACTDVCVPVPKGFSPTGKIRLALQVLDGQSGSYLKANCGGTTAVALASLAYGKRLKPLVPVVKPVDVPKTRRMKLVLEVPSSSVRVYENLDALPQAYFVKTWRLAETESDALELLMKEEFNPLLEAVFEESGGVPNLAAIKSAAPPLEGSQAEVGERQPAQCQVKSVKRPDINTVVVETSSQQKAILILTDVYYPGWVALLDGHKVDLLRANYLMRAVEVPPGEHTISFAYQPVTFLLGLSLAALTFLIGFVVSVVGFVRRAAKLSGAEDGGKAISDTA